MQNKIEILCTRPVDESIKDLCAANNISVEVISFIDTTPIETVEVQQEIENALFIYSCSFYQYECSRSRGRIFI